ncbi:MAG: hypothetical protein L6R19_05150 [Alphaproteobacteria bacterium]|nr:hypothetical protein [Alphaproteobacteria bacterium]
MSSPKQAPEAAARNALREERARDAERAMRDYTAAEAALDARTERLRALRLAREAANPPSNGQATVLQRVTEKLNLRGAQTQKTDRRPSAAGLRKKRSSG